MQGKISKNLDKDSLSKKIKEWEVMLLEIKIMIGNLEEKLSKDKRLSQKNSENSQSFETTQSQDKQCLNNDRE